MPPSARSVKIPRLHGAQSLDAIARADDGDMGHAILQKEMPDDEDYHLRAQKEEEASILTVCVALVLPSH